MSKVPFVDEVEIFNEIMGKGELNRSTPNIPNEEEWMFIYNFILEELEEYKEACETRDIISMADVLGDIMYVLCNGILLHGVKDKFLQIYQEIQDSNLSKVCNSEEEAKETVDVRSKQYNCGCHYNAVGDKFVVYRSSDMKVMKSINYFPPNLAQFFK